MTLHPPKFALATDGTVQDPYKPYAVFVVHFESPVFIASVDAGVASPEPNAGTTTVASTVRLIPVFVQGLEPGSTEVAAATHGLFHEAARFFAQTARIASYADAPPLVVAPYAAQEFHQLRPSGAHHQSLLRFPSAG